MNINTDKIVLGRITPVKKQVHISKQRSIENSFCDEFHRLIEDEATGIAETGKGYCFNEKQLEAIKLNLKNKLSTKEYATLAWKKEDGYFSITFKRTRKNYMKKQDLVLA